MMLNFKCYIACLACWQGMGGLFDGDGTIRFRVFLYKFQLYWHLNISQIIKLESAGRCDCQVAVSSFIWARIKCPRNIIHSRLLKYNMYLSRRSRILSSISGGNHLWSVFLGSTSEAEMPREIAESPDQLIRRSSVNKVSSPWHAPVSEKAIPWLSVDPVWTMDLLTVGYMNLLMPLNSTGGRLAKVPRVAFTAFLQNKMLS